MFDWPQKSSFEPPRYPNAWLCVSTDIAPTYVDAVRLVVGSLERYVGFEESLRASTNPECADAQRRVHHVQPVTGLTSAGADHFHDLHIRFYFTHLPPRNLHRITVTIDGQRRQFWRLAASVHYEPESEHTGHPYIDECPVCGAAPPYDIAGDRCEKCHDPLGLELLFYGTVRGAVVLRADGLPVGGLRSMGATYDVRLLEVRPSAPDMNTLRIGLALILPKVSAEACSPAAAPTERGRRSVSTSRPDGG